MHIGSANRGMSGPVGRCPPARPPPCGGYGRCRLPRAACSARSRHQGRRVGGQANNGTRPGAALMTPPSGNRSCWRVTGSGARRPSRRTLRPGPDCPAAARNRPRSAVRPRGRSRSRRDLPKFGVEKSTCSEASVDTSLSGLCGHSSMRFASAIAAIFFARESRRNAPRPAGCSRQGACGRFGRNRTWQTASLPWRSVCLSSSAAAPGANPILERLAHLGARPMRYICQRCLEPHAPDSLGLSRSCNLGA